MRKHPYYLRLARARPDHPGPRLRLRPLLEARSGLDLASGWPLPSAHRRRRPGDALSLRHKDRGFSRLPDLRRGADLNLHHRGRSLRCRQREHLRRRGSLAVRTDAAGFRRRDDRRPAGAAAPKLDAGSGCADRITTILDRLQPMPTGARSTAGPSH